MPVFLMELNGDLRYPIVIMPENHYESEIGHFKNAITQEWIHSGRWILLKKDLAPDHKED